MVTDAAGTGFEIKKPHKGTETFHLYTVVTLCKEFEIKKPHKGDGNAIASADSLKAFNYLKLRNPTRGRKLS